MAVTTFAYSGVQGNVMAGTAGATDVDMQKWDLKHEINTFDKTTTADLGWDSTGAATQKVGGSFTFFYNPTKDPYLVLLIGPGATPTLKMYINKTDAIFFTGQALITGLSYSIAVKEGVPVVATFVNQGPWTLPVPAGLMAATQKGEAA